MLKQSLRESRLYLSDINLDSAVLESSPFLEDEHVLEKDTNVMKLMLSFQNYF